MSATHTTRELDEKLRPAIEAGWCARLWVDLEHLYFCQGYGSLVDLMATLCFERQTAMLELDLQIRRL